MYCLIHNIVLLKNFLLVIGSQGAVCMGLPPAHKQMEILLTEHTTHSTRPFMQGNNSNEKH